MRLLHPERRSVTRWAAFCLYWLVVICLVFNLKPFERPREFVEMALGVGGCVFAVLAMRDAHAAFQEAVEVRKAVGSFRLSFRAILEAMVFICRDADSEIRLLLPTPAYGFLFGEEGQSRELVAALGALIDRRSTGKVVLYLVCDASPAYANRCTPQRYLRRAYELRNSDGTRVVDPSGYVALVNQVFDLAEKYPERVTIHTLRTDPNIRVAIADPDDVKRRKCVLAFACSSADEATRDFRSSGFTSTQMEMVHAARDLLGVYDVTTVGPDDLQATRGYFTVLL
jgi:hypothetical protein